MPNQPKREDRECGGCGKTFPARVSDLKRGFGRYCSRRCRNGVKKSPGVLKSQSVGSTIVLE